MNKEIENNQIDLIDAILILWKNKFKIIFSIVFAIIIMLIYLSFQKPTVILTKASTEIRPISLFDELKYDSYNANINYLKNITQKKLLETKELAKEKNSMNTTIGILPFRFIEKEYLLNLFLDRLNENSILIDAVKKFDLIKEKNYPSTKQYETAAIKLAASIKIFEGLQPNINKWTIQTTINDRVIWEKFLTHVNEIANKEVQKYIIDTFNRKILNEKNFIKYQIEDIDIELKNISEDEITRDSLKKKRLLLGTNKDLTRMQELFENSIITSEDFYAGKIMVENTKYEDLNSPVSKIKMLILASIIGAVFGMFFALISNALKKKQS